MPQREFNGWIEWRQTLTKRGARVTGLARATVASAQGINPLRTGPLVVTATAISTRMAGPGLVNRAGVVVVMEAAIAPLVVRTMRGREVEPHDGI
jgi:hypothetical protein